MTKKEYGILNVALNHYSRFIEGERSKAIDNPKAGTLDGLNTYLDDLLALTLKIRKHI